MSYAAVADRRMPYDNDGTALYCSSPVYTGGGAPNFGFYGANLLIGGTPRAVLNGISWGSTGVGALFATNANSPGVHLFWFFPEQREVTGLVVGGNSSNGGGIASLTLQGSNDTTSGVDGTWETATFPGGAPTYTRVANGFDAWRSGIKAVSFTGPKHVIRLGAVLAVSGGGVGLDLVMAHLYGGKAAGQTPDDILFLDGLTSFAEFASVEDFGDRPLGTTSTRTFKVKNGSATLTANSVNLQCNDADFAISEDNVTWVTTINIASLAAGASSSTLYVRNTTPAAGSALGPRFARVVAIVGSWT